MQASDLGAIALQGRLAELESQLDQSDYANALARSESRDLHQLCVKTRTMSNQVEETISKALLDLLLSLKKANGAQDSELRDLQKEEQGIQLVAHIKNTFVHYDTDHSFGFSFTEFASAFRGLGIEATDKKMRKSFEGIQRGGSVEEDDFIAACLQNHPDVSIDRFLRDLKAEVQKLLSKEESSKPKKSARRSVHFGDEPPSTISDSGSVSKEEYDRIKDENVTLAERVESMKYELHKMNEVNKRTMAALREKEAEAELRLQEAAHFKNQQKRLENTNDLLDEKKTQLKALQKQIEDSQAQCEDLELQMQMYRGREPGHESEKSLLQQRLMEAQGENSRLKSFAKNARATMQQIEDLYYRNIHATVLKLKEIQDKPSKEIDLWMKDRDAISMLSKIRSVYNSLDVNQDRQMDFSKFCQAWQRLDLDIPHAGLTKAWSSVDAEHIGFITEDQFEYAVLGSRPQIDFLYYTEVLAEHLEELEQWGSDVKDRSKNDELLKDIADLKFAVQHADTQLKKYREQCEDANRKLKPLSTDLPMTAVHKKRNSASLRNLEDIDELPYTVARICAQGSDLKTQYDAVLQNRDELQKELLLLQDELDTLLEIPNVDLEGRRESSKGPKKKRKKREKVDISDLRDTLKQFKDKLNIMRQNNELLIRQKKMQKEEYEKQIEDLQVQLEMCAASAGITGDDLQNSMDTISKIKERLDSLKEELAKKERENEELREKIASLKTDQKAMKKATAAEKELERCIDAMSTFKKQRVQELEDEERVLVEEAMDLEQEINSLQSELKEKSDTLKGALADVEELKQLEKDLQKNLDKTEETRLLGEEERSLLETALQEKTEEVEKLQEILLGHEAKLASQEVAMEHLHEALLEHEEKLENTEEMMKQAEESHLVELQDNFDLMNEVHEKNKNLEEELKTLKSDAGDRIEKSERESEDVKKLLSENTDPWEGWGNVVEEKLAEFDRRHVVMKENLGKLEIALLGKDDMIENLEERLKQMSSSADESTKSMDALLAEKQAEVDEAVEEKRKLEGARESLEDKLLEMEEDKAELNDKLLEMEESKAGLNDKLLQLEEEKAELKDEIEKLQGVVEKNQKSLGELGEENVRLEKQLGKLREEKSATKEVTFSLPSKETEIEALKADVAYLEEENQSLQERLEYFAAKEEEELAITEADPTFSLDSREKAVEALKADLRYLEEEKNEEIEELKGKLQEMEGKLRELNSNVSGLEKEGEEAKKELEESMRENESLRKESEESKKSIGEMEEALEMLGGDLREHLDAKHAEEHRELEELREQVKEMEPEVVELREKMKEMETLREKLEESERGKDEVEEKLREVETEKRELEAKLPEIENARKSIMAMETEKAARENLSEKVKDQSKKILKLTRALDTLHEKFEIFRKQKELVDDELNELREVLKEKDKELEDLYRELGVNRRKESSLMEDADGMSKSLADSELQNRKVRKELAALKRSLSEQSDKSDAAEKEMQEMKKKMEEMKKKLEEKNANNKKLRFDLDVKRKEVEVAKMELKEKDDEIARLSAKLKENDDDGEKVKDLEMEIVDLKQEIGDLKERLGNMSNNADERAKKLDALLAEKQRVVEVNLDMMEDLERKLKDVQKERDDLKQEKETLMIKNDDMERRDDKNDEIQKLKDQQILELDDRLKEEVARSDRLKDKVDDLLNEMEALESAKDKAGAEKKKLQSQAEIAEDLVQHLKEENSKLSAANLESESNLAEKDREIKALKSELKRMKTDLETLRQSHSEKDEHIEALSNEIEDALSQIENKKQDLKDQKQRQDHEKSALAVDVDRLRKEVDNLKKGFDKKDNELQQLGESMDKLVAENEELQKDVLSLQNDKQDLMREVESLQEEAERAKELDQLRDQLKTARKAENSQSVEVGRLKAQLQDLVNDIDTVEKEKSALTDKMREQESSMDALRNQIKDSDDQLKQKQEEIEELEDVLRNKNAENSRLQHVAGSNDAELEDLKRQLKRLKNEKAAVEKDRDNLVDDNNKLNRESRQRDIENRELANQNEVLGELVAKHEGEVEKLTLEIDDLTREQVNLKSSLTDKQNENEDLFDRLKSASEGSPRTIADQVQKLRDANERLQDQVDRLKSDQGNKDRAKDSQIEALQEEVSRKNREIDRMKENTDPFRKPSRPNEVEDEIVFDDDFFSKVRNKDVFLREFNDFIEDAGIHSVLATDVYAGSIKVKVRGDPDQIAKLKEFIKKNGCNLPSTGQLTPSLDPSDYRGDKKYNPDRDPPMVDLRQQLADALAEIERLKRLLQEQKQRVKEISDEADSVKQENRRLRRNFSDRPVSPSSDIEVLNDRIRALMHHNDTLTDNIQTKSQEVVGLRDALDELRDNQMKMDRKLREINVKLDDAKEKKLKLEDENEMTKEELQRTDEKLQVKQDELKEAQSKAAGLKSELVSKEDELHWLKNKLDVVTQEKLGIESTLSKEESDLRTLNRQLNKLKAENGHLQKNLKATDRQIDELKLEVRQKQLKIDEMNALKEKIDELQMEEIQRLRDQIQELEKVQQSLQNSLINRDTEINDLLEKIQQAKYTQDQYKQKLLKKKRDLQSVIDEIARAEEEERALKQTLAKKEAQIDTLREKVEEMNHTQAKLNRKLEVGQNNMKDLLSEIKQLEKEKQALRSALVNSQDETLEAQRKMEDTEIEMRKLRDDVADREEDVRDLVEKLRSKKVDYNDLESILRDKNQEIDYLRTRLEDARRVEQQLRRKEKNWKENVHRAERLGRLGPSPISLSLPKSNTRIPHESHQDDSQTGLSPKDNFLKAIKDVLGMNTQPSSPQAIIRGKRVGSQQRGARRSVDPYRKTPTDPYRSGVYAYNVDNDSPGEHSTLDEFMKRLQERRRKDEDSNVIEKVIQQILDKVRDLKKENSRLKTDLQLSNDKLARLSKDLERRIDPSSLPLPGKNSVSYLYAPSPSGELVPRLVNKLTELEEENSELKKEIRQLRRQLGENVPSRGPSEVRERYLPSKTAELVPGLVRSKLALQEKNGELLQYVQDLEDSLRRKDEVIQGRPTTPLSKIASPTASSILDKLRAKRHNRGAVAELVPKLIETQNELREENSNLKGELRKRKYDISRLGGATASPRIAPSPASRFVPSPRTSKPRDFMEKIVLYETVVEKLVNAVEELKRQNAVLRSDLHDKTREVSRLHDKVDENSEALSVKEKEHHNFKRKMRQKLEVVGTLKDKIGDLRQHRANMLQSRDALQEKNERLEQEVSDLERKLRHAEEQLNEKRDFNHLKAKRRSIDYKRRSDSSLDAPQHPLAILNAKEKELYDIDRALRSLQRNLRTRDVGQKNQVQALLKTVSDQQEIVTRIRKKNDSLLNELGDQTHALGYLARAQEGPESPREWNNSELKRLRNRVAQLSTLKEDMEIKQRKIVDLQDALRVRDLTMERLASQFDKKILSDHSITVDGRKDLSSLLTTINKLSQVVDFFSMELKEKSGEIDTLSGQLEERQNEVSKLRGKIRKKKAEKSTMSAGELSPEKKDLMQEYRKEIVRLRSFTREVRTELIDLEESSCTEFRDAIRKLMSRQGAPMKELEAHDKNRIVTLISQLRSAYVDYDHKHHMKLSYDGFLEACKSMGVTVPPHKLKKRFEKFSKNGRDLREAEFVCAVLDRSESELGVLPYAKHMKDLISRVERFRPSASLASEHTRGRHIPSASVHSRLAGRRLDVPNASSRDRIGHRPSVQRFRPSASVKSIYSTHR